MAIFYRYNSEFRIKDSELPNSAKNTAVKNALYAAVYDEFVGASENNKYKNLTTLERINKLNEFAQKWLDDKGFK
jgi:hypothetical protein